MIHMIIFTFNGQNIYRIIIVRGFDKKTLLNIHILKNVIVQIFKLYLTCENLSNIKKIFSKQFNKYGLNCS